MTLRDRLEIWCGLSLYYKWELLGVWLGLRCTACGFWKWQEPCYAEPHWME